VSVDGMEGEGQLLIIAAAFNKYLKKNNDYTTKQRTSYFL
jgi:hypothetical protein